jgi:hypothetical protein
MVVLPVITLPFSKDLWLAFDLMFRPPRPQDFAEDTPGRQKGFVDSDDLDGS